MKVNVRNLTLASLIIVIIVAVITLGVSIANLVYYNRLKHSATCSNDPIKTSQINGMLFINSVLLLLIIVVIIMVSIAMAASKREISDWIKLSNEEKTDKLRKGLFPCVGELPGLQVTHTPTPAPATTATLPPRSMSYGEFVDARETPESSAMMMPTTTLPPPAPINRKSVPVSRLSPTAATAVGGLMLTDSSGNRYRAETCTADRACNTHLTRKAVFSDTYTPLDPLTEMGRRSAL